MTEDVERARGPAMAALVSEWCWRHALGRKNEMEGRSLELRTSILLKWHLNQPKKLGEKT
jgi:hypothetical protein